MAVVLIVHRVKGQIEVRLLVFTVSNLDHSC